MVRSRCYQAGSLVDEGFSLEDVSEHLSDETTLVWVDLCPATAEDLDLVDAELGLHSLAVEAARTGRQRPTFTRYAGHDFFTVYVVGQDDGTRELRTHEIAVFVTPSALVTVRSDESFPLDSLLERFDASAELTVHGIGALVHALMDFVVDTHFDAVQLLDDEIEEVEDLLFDETSDNTEVQRRSFALRKSLVLLRRVVLPMREVVNSMMRRDVGLVPAALAPYFQDVYDHVLRASEWTESLRDLVTTILETNLTIQGNRLNVITKKVTSWAAIIAVPTAITGFYGQNLPYPGFADASGFIASSLLILLLSVGLYLAFRRKGWL